MNFQQKRLIDLANKCVNFGKYDYVKIILVRLLQNNTNNAEILSEISKLYIRMRKYDKAMGYARRAFELEKSVETLEALANACYVNKNYQDSAIMYEELTKYKKEEIIWLEDLIKTAESCASSELYPLLKREDEKFVTETAYENPKFVEDVIRDIVKKLDENDIVEFYEVEMEAFESIHNHNAWAYQKCYK